MKFKNLPEFDKDLKRLLKKYPSLPLDLAVLKEVLAVFPTGRGRTDQIPGLRLESKIFKTRLMCRSVKKSSFRLIYCFDETIEQIVFIEIYFKGNKLLEDRERIKSNFN